MSMILSLVAVSDANRERLLADPALVWLLLDEPDAYRAEREGAKRLGFLGRLFRKKSPPAAATIDDLNLAPGEGWMRDLDKAWHGLHFLLTGTAWEGEPPLDFLVRGGRELGTIDVGYGPARVFSASETVAITSALDALEDNELAARFDPEAMLAAQIYPEIWSRDPQEDDTLAYLLSSLETLREFLDHCEEQGLGMVVWLG